MPHPEWVTGTPPTPEQIRAVNTFDMVIDYTPIIINGRTDYKRYKVEWWYRKHQSSAKLEGGPAWWAPDVNDPSGGWIQPGTHYWYFGGYASDGALTGQDEPGFDFSAVFPYVSAFGWWRDDQPEQTVVVQQIVVEYMAGSEPPGLNDPPVAYDDSYSLDEDTTFVVSGPGVLSNDNDSDNDPLTAILSLGVAEGALNLDTNGAFTYTPSINFNGPDTFTYKANDGLDDSNVATVTLTVNPVNDAPQLTVPGPQVVNQETDLIITGISIADIDVGNNNLVVSLSAQSGSLTLNSTAGLALGPGDGIDDNRMTITGTVTAINAAFHNLSYRSQPGFFGPDTISFGVSDQGYSGIGGPLTDMDIINVSVSGTSQPDNRTFLPIIIKN